MAKTTDVSHLLNRKTVSGKTVAEELGLSQPEKSRTKVECYPLAKAVLPDPPKMNKLEGRYSQYLQLLKKAGQIVDWKHHPFKLRLANPACWYEIDFLVIPLNYEIELHETKGFMREDAMVKLKVAAEMFPYFRFKLVKWDYDVGDWVIKTLKGGTWHNE